MNFEHFFELSLDLLAVAGFDGYFRRVNPSWTRTLGWTTEELLGRPLVEFVHPEDREATLASRQQVRDGTPLIGFSNRYLCKDGTHRWLEWRSIGYSEAGLVYAVARDVTEAREAAREHQRLQEQLIHTEKMASLGRLAAGMAHGINNPLGFIMANLRTAASELRGTDALSPEQRLDLEEMLADSLEGTERIRHIVQALQTFARTGDERRVEVSVQTVVEQSLRLVEKELRSRARLIESYGATPAVEADDARLGEALVHVLLNAADAIAEGEAERNEIRVSTLTDESGNAVVEIEDTGSGIPADVAPYIFDPFFTTKTVSTGTGLGLSICHNIVTALGGEVRVESGRTGGARFRIVLPPASEKPPTDSGGGALTTGFVEHLEP